MKQISWLFTLWVAGVFATPNAFGQSVQWPIEAATVYERGAKIERAVALLWMGKERQRSP